MDPERMTPYEREQAQMLLLNQWLLERAKKTRKLTDRQIGQRIGQIVAVLTLGLFLPSLGHAQSVDSYQVRYYNAGAPSPLQVNDAFPITAATCNQAAPAAVNTVNPSRVVWDDPANAGKVCIFTVPATGALPALPIPGTYEATLAAINAAGSSAESARAPFSKLAPPPVPTGVKAVR